MPDKTYSYADRTRFIITDNESGILFQNFLYFGLEELHKRIICRIQSKIDSISDWEDVLDCIIQEVEKFDDRKTIFDPQDLTDHFEQVLRLENELLNKTKEKLNAS